MKDVINSKILAKKKNEAKPNKKNDLILLGSRKKVSASSIFMLKANINYTSILLDDGTQIESSTTLGILEKRLADFSFFRPNRSCIVNVKHIKEFVNEKKAGLFGSILLLDGQKIPISRRKISHIKKLMQ